MRVLVTGATGFVGSHTARALLDAGHQVRLLVRQPDKLPAVFGPAAGRFEVVAGDMVDAAAVGRGLDGQDAVVHAAALVVLEQRQAARVLEVNRAGVEQVVGAAVARGIGRILYVSSAVAMFRPGGPPITAASPIGDGDSAYMRSKVAGERHVRALQDAGAPIRITYPGGVFGPDDPGLSESNRGLLTLFRDLPVVTAGGLQVVDVRDVAAAHVALLMRPPMPGRHLLTGHFLRWAELLDLFERLTGRRRRRLPVPAAALRASGAIADVLKRVWRFELPLTHEAARIMTQWAPAVADPTDGLRFRDPAETVRDTLLWLHGARGLPAARLGALAPGGLTSSAECENKKQNADYCD